MCVYVFFLGIEIHFVLIFSLVWSTMWLVVLTQDIEENSSSINSNNNKSALIHCFCLLASASFLSHRIRFPLEQEYNPTIEKEVNQNQVGKYTIVASMLSLSFYNVCALFMCVFVFFSSPDCTYLTLALFLCTRG